MAVASPPNFFIALATLIPPPPGSNVGAEQLNFFSGASTETEVLLSMQGLNVMVNMLLIERYVSSNLVFFKKFSMA